MAIRSFRRKGSGDEDPAILAAEVDTVLRVLLKYPSDTSLSFGAPTRCPTCGDFGLAETVDQRSGRSYNRCMRCSSEWMISRRGLHGARTVMAGHATRGAHGAFVTFEKPDPFDLSSADRRRDAAVDPGLDLPTGVLFSRASDGDVNRNVVAPEVPAIPGVSIVGPSWAVPAVDPEVLAEPTGWRGRTGPMQLLLVEDDPHDIEVVRAILEPAGSAAVNLVTASTRAAGEEAARTVEPDLVLLDLGLPDSHGLATVTQWHFNDVHAPVLVVSGQCGHDVRDRGREFGVSGFVDKAELADLLALGDAGTTSFLDRLTAVASA